MKYIHRLGPFSILDEPVLIHVSTRYQEFFLGHLRTPKAF